MRGTTYAIAEIIWWLLVAALIGFAIGWLLRRWFLDRQRNAELDVLRAEEATKREALQAEMDDRKAKAASLASDLDHRQADVDRLHTSLEERAGKVAELEAAVRAHRGEMTKMESKVEDRESTIASLRSSMSKEDSQLVELRKEVDAANGTIGTLRKDADGYKNTIEALRIDLDKERRKQADLQIELDEANASVDAAASSLTNARSRADELEARIAELQAGASGSADLEARIAVLETELSRVRGDRDTTAAKLAEFESEHADCAARLAAADQSAAAQQAVVAPVTPETELPDREVAVARVAEIATRTRGNGPRVEDDLKKIHGVGPKLEGLLKSMDITSFRQVAHFTPGDIHYVTAALDAFPGRIERDDWMSSAAEEHSKKYNEPV